MFKTFIIVSSLFISAAANEKPGKLAIWKYGQESIGKSSNTRTMDIREMDKALKEDTSNSEVLVFMKHAHGLIPKSVIDHMESANTMKYYPHVYLSAEHQNSMENVLLSSKLMRNAQTDLSLLKKDKSLFNNKKVDAFVVQLNGDENDLKTLQELTKFASTKNIAFVALEEPTSFAPAEEGDYRRILNGWNIITEDDLYLPEGTEWTIFYAGQFLYLTPELFTGLMTMIFMFFVGLIGFQCLGDVQGPSTFPNKLPPLGKEG